MASVEIYVVDDGGQEFVAFAEGGGDTHWALAELLDSAVESIDEQLGESGASDQHELSDGCCASSGALRECCDCDDFTDLDLVVMDPVEYLNQIELVFRDAGHRVVDLAHTIIFSFAKGFRDAYGSHSDHHFTD